MDETRNATNWRNLATSYPVRLAVYGLITLLVFQGVFALLQVRGLAWLAAENGPLELAQVGLLLLAVAGTAVAIRWSPAGKAVMATTCAVTIYAAARESDQWFETVFFDDAYKWLVGLPVALLLAPAIWRERHQFVADALWIAQKPGATLFAAGGICLCCFCQILDRPLFWPSEGIDGQLGLHKAMVEESAELFAYLLIAFSGLEAMISAAEDRAAAQEDSGLVLQTGGAENAGPSERRQVAA